MNYLATNHLGQPLENPLWRELGVQGISVLVRATSGSGPQVTRYPDYTQITLTPPQIEAAQSYLEDLLDAEPGPIRVNVSEVVLPVVVRRYGPMVAMGAAVVVAVGFMLGRASK